MFFCFIAVLSSLRQLSAQTSVLSSPEKLQEEAINEVMRSNFPALQNSVDDVSWKLIYFAWCERLQILHCDQGVFNNFDECIPYSPEQAPAVEAIIFAPDALAFTGSTCSGEYGM